MPAGQRLLAARLMNFSVWRNERRASGEKRELVSVMGALLGTRFDHLSDSGEDVKREHCNRFRQFNYPTPQYAHIPLVRDQKGEKVSKSDGANPIDAAQPLSALKAAWRFLKQRPLIEPIASVDDFWSAASKAWRIEALQQTVAKRPNMDNS